MSATQAFRELTYTMRHRTLTGTAPGFGSRPESTAVTNRSDPLTIASLHQS